MTMLSVRLAASAAVAAVALLAAPRPAGAADAWTFSADLQEPPGFADKNVNLKQITYAPLATATKPWRICVSHPHLADAYHLSYNYGYVEEARRLGVQLTSVEAGGYDKLPKQISQIEDCVAKGADAVVISAISFTGLDNLIQELDGKGVAVIDLGNGVQTPLVKAHSLGSYEIIGEKVGQYLAQLHPKGSDPVKVLWLPGPAGAGWSEAGNTGFQKGVADSAVEILDTKYGNSNKPEQLKLVEDALQTFDDVDYIVGVAPAIEGAVGAIKDAGRPEIKLISYYQSPEVASLLEQGEVFAMASDAAVMQGRVALDQAVRVLEGAEVYKHVSPAIQIVDAGNVKTWNKLEALAPSDWSPVFSVEPKAQ